MKFVLDFRASNRGGAIQATGDGFLTSKSDKFIGNVAVTGQGGGKATLEALDRGNLFLVPLDDRRQWYRYHHLFADVLRARLLDEEPERIDELHRRASAWFETAGDADRAVRHAVAAEDFLRAERLVVEHTPSLYTNGNYATVHRWIESLPREQVAASVARAPRSPP